MGIARKNVPPSGFSLMGLCMLLTVAASTHAQERGEERQPSSACSEITQDLNGCRSNAERLQSQVQELDQRVRACEETQQGQKTQLGVCQDQLAGKQTPAVIENNISQYFGYLSQHPGQPKTVVKDGHPLLIYDVVFGTVSIPARVEVRKDKSVPFVVEFTPQNWMRAEPTQGYVPQAKIAWSMRVDNPEFQNVNAVYDTKRSNDPSNDRSIGMNRTEVWVWQLSPKPDFEEEQWPVGATLAYAIAGGVKGEREVVRQNVSLTMRPGFFSRLWKIAVENEEIKVALSGLLVAVIGLLTALVGAQTKWIRRNLPAKKRGP